jgi:DNA-binding CsgD family transcriptional regulator
MQKLTARDLRAISGMLTGLYATVELNELLERIVPLLGSVIPSAGGLCLHLDLAHRRLLQGVGFPQALPRAARLERALNRHPRLVAFLDGCTEQTVQRLDVGSQPDQAASLLLGELYQVWGVRQVLGIGLPAEAPGVIWLELHHAQTAFAARDEAVLEALRPHLTLAVQNAQRFTRVATSRRLLRRAGEELGLGLVDLRPTPRVRRLSPRAQELLTQYFGPHRVPGQPVPPVLVDWVRQQENQPEPSGSGEPLVVAGDSGQLHVHLVPGPGHTMLLLEEQPEPAACGWPELGLTHRESEVMRLLVAGRTNGQVAGQLGMARRTVGKHLEHIFDKLGVQSRAAAVARVLNAPVPGQPERSA